MAFWKSLFFPWQNPEFWKPVKGLWCPLANYDSSAPWEQKVLLFLPSQNSSHLPHHLEIPENQWSLWALVSPEGLGVQEAPAAHLYPALLCEAQVAHVFLAPLFSLVSQEGLYHLVGLEMLEPIRRNSWTRLRVLVLLLGDKAKGIENPNSCPKSQHDGFWFQRPACKKRCPGTDSRMSQVGASAQDHLRQQARVTNEEELTQRSSNIYP